MAKGLGRDEGFYWTGDLKTRLHEEVDPGALFSLRALDTNIVNRNPGSSDAPVCGPHQSDGDPNLHVSTLPRVDLPPLCCKATEYPFQGSRHLQTQYPIN